MRETIVVLDVGVVRRGVELGHRGGVDTPAMAGDGVGREGSEVGVERPDSKRGSENQERHRLP